MQLMKSARLHRTAWATRTATMASRPLRRGPTDLVRPTDETGYRRAGHWTVFAPVHGREVEMSETDRVVAVTGATGRQGGAVAHHLLAEGWRVRALTRKPDGGAARRLAARGAEVVAADMDDRAALVRAFRGAYGVFSVQNPMISGLEAEVRQGRNVGEAAREAGVQHVVYASAGVGGQGTGIGSWESKAAVQAHLGALGLQLTVLRPMAFMEIMIDRAFYPAVAMWYLMPKLTGADLPIGWISVEDVGAVALRAFADPDRFVGADLQLTADVRSNAECREIWRTVTGRRPRRFPMPIAVFERFVGTDLTTMWRWLATASLHIDPAPTREILPTASSVETWLTKRKLKALPPHGLRRR